MGLSALRAATLPVVLSLCATGCAVCRGFDFGHIAGKPEKRSLTRVTIKDRTALPSADSIVLVLAPFGEMAKDSSENLHTALLKETRQNLPGRVSKTDPDTNMARYLSQANLMPTPGVFDAGEIARSGRILGATHVIAAWVYECRTHAPQNVDLFMILVDAEKGTVAAEISGQFDAAEQKVSVAMNNYLQACSARHFDKTSIEIIRLSPREYQAFVAYYCLKSLGLSVKKGNNS